MSAKKYYDADQDRFVELSPDDAAYFASTRARDGVSPRFTPADGVYEVAREDGRGQVWVENMDAGAVFHAGITNNPLVTVLGDANREQALDVARAHAEDRYYREQAREQNLATFFGNVVPGGRAIDRLFMDDEEAEHDAYLARIQDEENPIMAGLGTATGLVGAAMIPVPGLGAAAGLFRAGKAGKSAMSLMGLGRSTAGAVARGVGGATPGFLAHTVGGVVGGMVTNLPLSMQYQVAHIVDYDEPLSIEAASRDLGAQMLMGAVVDAAIPFGKVALGTIKALSPVAQGARLLGKLPGLGGLKGLGAKMAGANSIRKKALQRLIAQENAERGVYNAAVEKLKPSAISGLDALDDIAKSVDDIAVRSTRVASDDALAGLKDGLHHLQGLQGRAASAQGQAATFASYLDNFLAPSLSEVKVADPARAALHLGSDGQVAGVFSPLKGGKHSSFYDDYIALGNKLGPNPTSAQVVEALEDGFKLRNALVKATHESADPHLLAASETFRTQFDRFISESSLLGNEASSYLQLVAQNSDTLLSASSGIRSELDNLIHLDLAKEPGAFGAPKILHEAERARAALETLGKLGADYPVYASVHFDSLRKSLNAAAPGYTVAAKLNSLKSIAADEVKVVFPPRAADGYTKLGVVEAVGAIFQEAFEPITKGVEGAKVFGAGRNILKTGIWEFRNMTTYEEKKAAFDDVVRLVDTLGASEDALIYHVQQLTESLQDEPSIANGIAYNAIAQIQYLKSKLPRPTQGTLAYGDYQYSPSEVAKTLEIAGALRDPLSILPAVLDGSLTKDSLDAVQAVYPRLLSEMRTQISEQILADPEKYRSAPYTTRLSIDRFVGGGFEPSANPNTLHMYQSVVGGQEAAQRQPTPSTPSRRNPEQYAQGSDRLSLL